MKVCLQQSGLKLKAFSGVFRGGGDLPSHLGDDLQRVVHHREAVGVLVATGQMRLGSLICEPDGYPLLVQAWKHAPSIVKDSVSGLQIFEVNTFKQEAMLL